MREDLDLRAIAAADSERAYLLRNTSVRAIRPADGETIWERTFPVTGLVGVPTLSDRGLWCPTWEALYLVDPASGDVITERSWGRREACSFIIDLGDRVAGASRLGLRLIGPKLPETSATRYPVSAAAGTETAMSIGTADAVAVSEDIDAATRTGNPDNDGEGDTGPMSLSPESAAPAVTVTIPTRADSWLRWAMPTSDSGDAVLSWTDPGRFVTRSDLLRMWSFEPVPTLIWERLSPLPWRCAVEFDRDRVVVWDRGRIVVLDAGTGRTLWQDGMPAGPPEDANRRAALADGVLITWGDHEVRCYSAATGERRWERAVRGRVAGCVPNERGIAVYSTGSPCSGVLLDRTSGEVLAEVSIPDIQPKQRPEPPPGQRPPQLAQVLRLLVGQTGAGKCAPGADVVLVNGVAPVRVDWERGEAVAGEPIETPVRGTGAGFTLEAYGRCVALKGRTDSGPHYDEPLVALWDAQTLARLPSPAGERWHVCGGRLYTFSGHRAMATDLATGERLWISRPFKDRCRLMMATERNVVLITQRGWWGEDGGRDVSSIRVLDAKDGEIVEYIRLPKGWIHLLDQQPGRVVMWDIAYLYDVEPPSPAAETVLEDFPLPPKDAGAITALRAARDLSEPPAVEIPVLDETPVVDGSLDDWYPVEALRLNSLMDWKPDFVLRTHGGMRIPRDKDDASAAVYLGRTGDAILVGIEVADDVHVAEPRPGLWRGDAVTLWWAHTGGETTDPRMLTVAFAGGAPRYELGTAAEMWAVSDPPGANPLLSPGPRSFALPSLGGRMSGDVSAGGRLEVAVRRDEPARTTVYEMRVPEVLWPVDTESYWDVIIHDNDGEGREGGLQLASSLWCIEETGTGAVHTQPPEE